MHIHTYLHLYVCIYTYKHMYTYIYTHTYIYIYIYIYVIHPFFSAEPRDSELLRHLLAASGEVIDPRSFFGL